MRPKAFAVRSRNKASPFLYRRTSFIAYGADPRFSYCLFVPAEIQQICVYVHGTYRDAAFYRDQLTDFAIRNQVLLVCPLFPAGLMDPWDVENYKLLRFHEIRYDLVLLGMLEEISQRYEVPRQRFMLGGFPAARNSPIDSPTFTPSASARSRWRRREE